MADSTQIQGALNQLDPTNDEHWTADGQPRLDALKGILGESVTRDEVTLANADFKRPTTDSTVPPAPPAPAGTDDGLRGSLGPATAAVPPAPPVLANVGAPVPPENVDGEELPQPDPRTTAPPADGLPTAREPTRIEGAPSAGLKVDEPSGPKDSIQEAMVPNTHEEDVVDAMATVAPSSNAPTTLGGPLEPHELEGVDSDGLTTAFDATGEVALPSLDGGHVGNPELVEELEAELKTATAKSDKLREQADDLAGQLRDAAANESRIRAAIEAATPRTGTMQAIQSYFTAQDKMAEDAQAARQALLDSGVDLKALGALTQRSPLDAASQPK